MPRPRKPPGQRVDNRSERGLRVIEEAWLPAPVVPKPPSGLLKVTRDWWSAFWQSEIARAVDAMLFLEEVERLATLLDERERCRRAVRKQRLVEGSKGQPVAHPLFRMMLKLDAEVRQLEDRFGLNPRARLRLGIQVGQLHGNVDRLN